MPIACPVIKLQVPSISVQDFYQKISRPGEYTILDVRSPMEFDEGHIQNAVLLPYTEVKAKVAQSIPDKNRMVYVYCASGSRSSFATRDMMDVGYVNVINVTGGIMAWVRQGYPLSEEKS